VGSDAADVARTTGCVVAGGDDATRPETFAGSRNEIERTEQRTTIIAASRRHGHDLRSGGAIVRRSP
jgi:hypothetical protein